MSLGGLSVRAIQWTERLASWVRPGVYGALFVWLLMLARGGLVLIPVLLAYLAFKKPHDVLGVAVAIFAIVPMAGFLGGMAYGATGLVTIRLGRAGRIMQFIAAAWVYCAILMLVIIPWLDKTALEGIPLWFSWALATGMGILFGAVLGFSAKN